MSRILLLVALLLAMLTLGVAPALAVASDVTGSSPSATRVTGDDEWGDEDPGDDWGDEDPGDPGDDWGDEDPGGDEGDPCVVFDEDGNVVEDESCWDEDDPCLTEDDPEDGCIDDDATGDAAREAPPRVSALHASARRHGSVRIRFRLDRAGRVTLALARLDGRASRTVGVRGTASVIGRSGANATTLRRWKGHRLKAGSYRLTATPATTGGHGATATFTVRAPARGR